MTSWTLDVRCSKGTYIRTLAEDIGEALGCGAHLARCAAPASGALTLDGAVTLEALAAMNEAERDAQLLRRRRAAGRLAGGAPATPRTPAAS